jgi:hypothetical protein
VLASFDGNAEGKSYFLATGFLDQYHCARLRTDLFSPAQKKTPASAKIK